MALKRNKAIWLCLLALFRVLTVSGQYDPMEDSIVYEEGAIKPPDLDLEPQTPYDPVYHFNDSEQVSYNMSEPEPKFNRDLWKKLTRDLSFEEGKPKPKDTASKKKDQLKPEKKPAQAPAFMKYAWIIMAGLILLFVLIKFVPAFGKRNIRNKQDLIISLDQLDEEEIKAIEIETPLSQALRDGDYRTAYRLRYLSVLKQLINRNMILYKKEKTNYEYLLQLTGKPVYEPFRLLTFNFDGIWYGELHIDKERYESLDGHFVNFNHAIKA